MKFGYMSGFRTDLISEIKFAKRNFDFTEITIQPNSLKTIDGLLNDLKKTIGDFMVLGHIHWEIIEFDGIVKNIEILKNLGCKKVTIHPFQGLTIEENAKIFNEINAFLQNNGIELLIENVSSSPYNSSNKISELLGKVTGANITLDVGHASMIHELDKFIDSFKAKIKHIHLHDNIENSDHLFFEDQDRLDRMLSKIKSFGYDDTILLETFSVMRDGKKLSQEFPGLKKLHIEQLKRIKNSLSVF